MRHKAVALLFLMILAVVFLAGLRAQSAAALFGPAVPVQGRMIAAAWDPAFGGEFAATELEPAACTSFPAADWLLPENRSVYMAGLQALSAGDTPQARAHFTRAVEESGHPLALIFLANMSAEPVEAAIYAGNWTDDMRQQLAEYYLTLAGGCQLAGAHETARFYLEWGTAFLPPAGLVQLPLYSARLVSNIYLADQEWAAALPWLEHAAAANDSALLSLAHAYYQLGRLDDSVAAYERALIYYPQRSETRLRAAIVFAESGNIPAALETLAGQDDPLQLGIEGLLYWAELCAAVADPACQENQFRRVLILDPQNETATAGLQTLQP